MLQFYKLLKNSNGQFATRLGARVLWAILIALGATTHVYAQCTVNAGAATTAICQGGTSATLGGSFGGTSTGALWSAPSGTFSANNTGGTPGAVTFTAAANSSTPVTLTLTAQGACGVVTATKNIVVNVRPSMTSATSATLCSGTPVGFGLTASTASTFVWVAANQGSVTGESTGNTTSATISNTLTNTTAINQVVVYTVTPTSTSTPTCAGTAQIVNITVNPPNAITTQPVAALACVGSTVTYTAAGNGLAATFNWQQNTGSGFVNITDGGIYAGATTGTLTITGVTAVMSGYTYRYTVNTNCLQAVSNAVALTITSISNNTISAAQSVCTGNSPGAAFTGTAPAGGVGGYTYLWESSTTSAVAGFATAPGVSNSFGYNVNGIAHTQTTWYRRTVTTAGSCTNTSSAVAITVLARPVMTSATSATLCSGTPVGFGLTSDITSTYVWAAASQGSVTGETTFNTTSATISNTLTNSTAINQVVVYTVTPTSTSAPTCAGTAQIVNITVNPPNVITTQPVAVTACAGATVAYTSVGTGLAAAYQWQENRGSGFTNLTDGGIYSGATTSTLSLTDITAIMSGYTYRQTVNTNCAAANSNAVALTITSITNNTLSATQGICVGQNPLNNFTATNPAGGVGAYTYLWESSTTDAVSGFAPAAGTNNATTYAVSGFAHSVNTWYRRTVTTTNNCANVAAPVAINVFAGAQGDPTVFPSGQWNVYGYTAPSGFNTFGTYNGYYTDAAVNINTGSLWANGTNASNAITWQGCTMPQANFALSFKRTDFTPGYYRVDITNHDDGVQFLVNGVQYYSLNSCCAPRPNIYTGYIGSTDNVEARLWQGNGGSYLQMTFTPVAAPVNNLVGGTIGGAQSICTGQVPQQPLSNIAAATSNCTVGPYQWQWSDDNTSFVNIDLATSAAYTITTSNAQTLYYRRMTQDGCGNFAFSNVITVAVDNSIYGDQNVWGLAAWNVYSFNDFNFTNYTGFYTEPLLSFQTTDRFTTTQSPSWASGYKGCQVQNTSYSAIMRRLGAPALPAGQVYQVDLASINDVASFWVDSVQYYTRGCCVAAGSPITNIYTGPMDGTTNLELRWQGGGGTNFAGLTFNSVPRPASVLPGSITGTTTLCNGDLLPGGFSSATLPSAGCTISNYVWQLSANNGATWQNLPNSNSASYTPTQGIYGAPGATFNYRRVVFDVCGNTAASAPAVITIQNVIPGNPATFGSNTWNCYAYDDQNFALYVGYYTEDNLTFDSRTRYAQTNPFLPPSAATASGASLAYQGCQQFNSFWSVVMKRQGLGANAPGYYQINIPTHDDNITLLINGVQVYQHIGCCDGHDNVWTGYLDNNSTLEWRLVNFPGPGYLSAAFVYLGVTPPAALVAGSIGSGQTAYCPGDAFTLTSVADASGGCYPVYQWQQYDELGLVWNNINGATASTYTPVLGISTSTQYRRGATDICGNALVYTAAMALSVSSPVVPVMANDQWTALLYNATDFTSNFVGYYTETNLNVNTTLRHGNASPPSTANGASGASYIGCLTNSTNYSVRYIRTGFPAGQYSINIPSHDDNAFVFVNGVQVFGFIGCCVAHTNIWTGTLSATDNVELRYLNNGGPGNLSVTFNASAGSTAITAGTIASTQTICFNAAPAAFTQTVAASSTCSVNNYQWQSSLNNSTFASIVGATAAAYTSPALTQTTFFRRIDINGCGVQATTNTLTVTVNPLVVAGTITGPTSTCSNVVPSSAMSISVAPTAGNGTYTYQWQQSTDNIIFSNIGGATAVTYTPVGRSVTYFYRLGFISCGSTVHSNVHTISINAATAITTQPAAFTGCAAGTAAFSVIATGVGLGYQWQTSVNSGGSWANVASAGNASTYSVTIPGSIVANTLQFRVLVTGTCAATSITSSAVALNIGAPTITTQPATQTVCAGNNVTFTVVASGAATFQWQQDPATGTFANIGGATLASYTLTGATTASTLNRFRCIATNSCAGTTTSANATLTVQPVIAGNTISGNQTLCSGNMGSALSVNTPTGGSGAYTYQWQASTDNATFANLGGATAAVYTPTGFTQQTWLRRVVTSGSCTNTSGVVIITIAPNFSIATQPVSSTVCPGTTATYTVVPAGSAVTYQWQDSTNNSGWGTANGGFYTGENTASILVNPASAARDGSRFRVIITGTGSCAAMSITSRSVLLTTAILPAITVQPVNTTTCNTAAINIGLTATGATLTYQWQALAPGGSWSNVTNGTNFTNVTTAALRILSPSATLSGFQFRCNITNTCNAPITSNAVTFTFQPVVAFNSVSSTQTICSGNTPVLLTGSVPTGGNGTFTYQWQQNVANAGYVAIVGATALDFQPGVASVVTLYRRLVTSSNCNQNTSPAITINVDVPPAFTTNPAATLITCAGASTSATVAATGNNVAYQWQLSIDNGATWANVSNGTRYNGATALTLNIVSAPATFSGYQYRCAATGDCGGVANSSVNSTVTTLTVNGGATVTSSPADRAICAGGTSTFQVGYTLPAPGNLSLLLLWQERIGAGAWTNLSNGGVYSGAGTANLTITNAPITMSGRRYKMLVIYGGCQVSSNSTLGGLTVNALPTIFVTANPTTVCNNGTSSTLNASGATTYLWSTTETGNTIINIPASIGSNVYNVIGTNAATGCQNTGTVSVTVNPMLAPAVTIATASTTVCTGSTVTFTATPVNGGTTPVYQWRLNGANVGTNSTVYTTSTLANGNVVSLVLTTNAVCPTTPTATSNSLNMQIDPAAVATAGAAISNICQSASPSPITLSGASVSAGASTGAWSIISGGGSLSTTAQTATPAAVTYTPDAGYAGSVTLQLTSNATGLCAAASAMRTITINTLPTAAISYPGSPVCQSSGGTQAVSLVGTTGGVFSSAAGLAINNTTGLVNVAGSAAANYTVTYTLAATGGCAQVQTTSAINLTPNVSAPGTPIGPLALCQGSAPQAYIANAASATSYAWSVTGAGNSASGTGATGTITFGPVYNGTATISVTATGCGGTTSAVSTTVTIHPNGTWLGSNTDWADVSNWCGGLPTATTDIMVPAAASINPVLSGSSTVRGLNLGASTTLTLGNTASLTIMGTFTGSTGLVQGSNSTVTYAAASTQGVAPASYVNLTTSGGAKTFSGTTNISGTFIPSGSSHTTTGSTIGFNGAADQTIPAFGFNNLTTTGGNNKSLAGTVTVAGNLALTNGLLTLGSNQLQLNGTVTGAGQLATVCGSDLQIGGAGNTGTLTFAAGANTLGRLAMAKSAAGDVTLGSDLNICTTLSLTLGKVVLGSRNLTVLPSATASGGNATAYIVTADQVSPTTAGFYIQQVPQNGGARTFPVGNATYTPAVLTNVGTTANFRVRAFSNVYENGIAGALIQNNEASVKKTWEIAPTTGAPGPNVAITLQWTAAEEGTFFTTARSSNPSITYLGKNTGIGSSAWVPQVVSARNYSGSPYSITTPSITSFSKFAIGSESNPLPVSMGDLFAKATPVGNRLSWTTYSEVDAKGFYITRSENGKDFTDIGYVNAAGAPGAQHTYSFVDKANARRTYYKVRFQGNSKADVAFSNTATVAQGTLASIGMYPNPTQALLFVSAQDGDDNQLDQTSFRLTDISGKQTLLHINAFNHQGYKLNLANMHAGVYTLEKLVNDQVVAKGRVIKL